MKGVLVAGVLAVVCLSGCTSSPNTSEAPPRAAPSDQQVCREAEAVLQASLEAQESADEELRQQMDEGAAAVDTSIRDEAFKDALTRGLARLWPKATDEDLKTVLKDLSEFKSPVSNLEALGAICAIS